MSIILNHIFCFSNFKIIFIVSEVSFLVIYAASSAPALIFMRQLTWLWLENNKLLIWGKKPAQAGAGFNKVLKKSNCGHRRILWVSWDWQYSRETFQASNNIFCKHQPSLFIKYCWNAFNITNFSSWKINKANIHLSWFVSYTIYFSSQHYH